MGLLRADVGDENDDIGDENENPLDRELGDVIDVESVRCGCIEGLNVVGLYAGFFGGGFVVFLSVADFFSAFSMAVTTKGGKCAVFCKVLVDIEREWLFRFLLGAVVRAVVVFFLLLLLPLLQSVSLSDGSIFVDMILRL